MRITPLEVQNHQFSRRFSGIDPEEVASFLKLVADDYQQLVREIEQLRDSVRHLEKRNDELASGEKILRETLVSAQSMAEKFRETAVAESEVLLNTAELRAEKILDASHRRAATLSEEIRELQGLRKRFAASLRSTIDTHLGLIERLEQDDQDPISGLTGVVRGRTAPRPASETPAQPSTPPPSTSPSTTVASSTARTTATTAPPALPSPTPGGP